MSKYYNKDERFVPLMEKIANELIRRVRQTIDIRTIFSLMTSNDIECVCRQGKHVLVQWKNIYQSVRRQLEINQRTFSAWNFDQHILFDKTDYVSTILDDLIDMSSNLTSVNNLFARDLNMVTTDSDNTVRRLIDNVSLLKRTFLSCHFDPFQRASIEQWRIVRVEFQRCLSSIEHDAQQFIGKAWTRLRSADTALDLLGKCQRTTDVHVLTPTMISQYSAVLVQYVNELDMIERIFHDKQNHPSIVKVMNRPSLTHRLTDVRYVRAIRLWPVRFVGHDFFSYVYKVQ
jgi:hypothetical protein